jgi:hypothetical protein
MSVHASPRPLEARHFTFTGSPREWTSRSRGKSVGTRPTTLSTGAPCRSATLSTWSTSCRATSCSRNTSSKLRWVSWRDRSKSTRASSNSAARKPTAISGAPGRDASTATIQALLAEWGRIANLGETLSSLGSTVRGPTTHHPSRVRATLKLPWARSPRPLVADGRRPTESAIASASS